MVAERSSKRQGREVRSESRAEIDGTAGTEGTEGTAGMSTTGAADEKAENAKVAMRERAAKERIV